MTTIKGAVPAKEFEQQVAPPKEVKYLRTRVKELESVVEKYSKEEGRVKEIMDEIKSHMVVVRPYDLEYAASNSPEESVVEAVLQLSDWHYGATQVSDEIEGFGEFSPAIAKERVLAKLTPQFIEWTNIQRKGYVIDNLRILVEGDLISGDIHDELKITNAVPSPVQAVEVSYLFADMVRMLAPHFANIVIEFVTADNHSRLTTKPQCKEEGLNSYGYIIAHLSKELLGGHKNVAMNIYNTYQTVVGVNEQRYLIGHGHNIRGWAGIPYYGIERKVGREARKRLRAPESLRNKVRFDKLVIGHFHSPINTDDWMIGGSLSGTDAYDHKAGRYSRPVQPCWLVHPKHGDFNWTRLWID